MSRATQRQQSHSSDKFRAEFDTSLPLISKIQDIHIKNLEGIITMLCQLISDFTKVIEHYQIQFTSQQLSARTIVAIKQANNEIKYHQKINPMQREQNVNVTAEIDQVLQHLAKLRIKQIDSTFPKMKKHQDGTQPVNFAGQLSTITEKESQQNLHNYLKTNIGSKRRSKSNINKNNFLYNTSSIEDIEFEVIREETRKSLDNPYHKNNQNRKSLYNDLEKIKGQDSLLPAVKNYLDKHKKQNGSKPPQYIIQKLI